MISVSRNDENAVIVLRQVFDYFYLLLFGIILTYHFIISTMMRVVWPEGFLKGIIIALGLVVFMRLVVTKITSYHCLLIAWVLFSFMLFSYYHSQHTLVLETGFLMIGAMNLNYKKMLGIYVAIIAIGLVTMFVFTRLGLIVDLVYSMYGHQRHSFGIIYPTNFAAFVFYAFLAWFLLREDKITNIECGIMAFIAIMLEVFCHTRLNEGAIVVIVIASVMLKNKKIRGRMNDFFMKKKCVSMIIPMVCMMIPFFAARVYNPSIPFLRWMDDFSHGRMVLARRNLSENALTLFGQNIKMVGNGGSLKLPEHYTFIDISYLHIAMRFGIIILLCVLVMIWVFMIRVKNNAHLIFAMILVCVTSLIEHHLFDFCYNILIILPFASLETSCTTIQIE